MGVSIRRARRVLKLLAEHHCNNSATKLIDGGGKLAGRYFVEQRQTRVSHR
jgi:hypothetical protein